MTETVAGEKLVRDRSRIALEFSYKYNAEAMGLLWSLNNTETMPYNENPVIQKEFDRGFFEGREMLKAAAASTAVTQQAV